MIEGAEAAIQFMLEVLGGQEIRRFPAEDGGIMPAEVRLGDSAIMLGGAGPRSCGLSQCGYNRSGSPGSRGAQSIQAPVQQEGETDRRAGLQLPTGTTFWLATQVG